MSVQAKPRIGFVRKSGFGAFEKVNMEPITKDVIVQDMPFADYLAEPAISASILKRLDELGSPAHVKMRTHNESESMLQGTALHTMLMAPDKFDVLHYVRPKIRRAGKANLAAIEQFEADNPGKSPIQPEQHENLKQVVGAVKANPFAGPILSETRKEVSIFWHDEEIDADCKARFDMLGADYIADLKSTRCAERTQFTRDVLWKFRYWIQAVFYYRGARHIGLPVKDFHFIAIELEAPFGCTVHTLEESELMAAQSRVVALAKQWAECVKTGYYPAYPLVRNLISIGGDDE